MDIEGLDLNKDDVVQLGGSGSSLQKYGGFITQLKEAIARSGIQQYFNGGLEIQFLKTTGGGWQKGKLHLRFEFVPDEPADNPESLDALRRQLGTDQ